MSLIGGLAGGVDDEKQMAAKIGHHQVIENAPRLIGELGIALASRCNRQNVLRHQPFQRERRVLDLARLRPHHDLAHMRDVEQTGAAAGMEMLPEHPGRELHRHLVAGEWHHFSAARDMQRMQGRALQW